MARAKRPDTYQIANGPQIRVYDNGGATLDRFTVVIDDQDATPGMKSMLGLSEGGRGFSQFSEGQEGPHLGRGVTFESLEEETRNHIVSRLRESTCEAAPADNMAYDYDRSRTAEEHFLPAKSGAWTLWITKGRASRWDYTMINPQGGSFGTTSFTSARAAFANATGRVNWEGHTELTVGVAKWDAVKEKYVPVKPPVKVAIPENGKPQAPKF